jgi:uncharacterized membrane protein YhaH (DUF805 family)
MMAALLPIWTIALFIIALILPALWLLWISIKIVANRVHDLGYSFWVAMVYLVVTFPLAICAGMILHVQHIFVADFILLTLSILSLMINYYLMFEKGPDQIPYERAKFFKKGEILKWPGKVAIGINVLITFGGTLTDISKHLMH